MALSLKQYLFKEIISSDRVAIHDNSLFTMSLCRHHIDHSVLPYKRGFLPINLVDSTIYKFVRDRTDISIHDEDILVLCADNFEEYTEYVDLSSEHKHTFLKLFYN